MLNKFQKNEKGFTLIELLIVVAIIGILAAIAIPQFASYRMRSYNSAALSDLRNVKTAQESLWADAQCYGNIDGGLQAATVVIQTAAPAIGTATYTGPIVPASLDNTVAGGRVCGVNLAEATSAIPFGVSNGVNLECTLSNNGNSPTGAGQYDSYVMATRHNSGDTAYGADSDNGPTTYVARNSIWPTAPANINLVVATTPAPTVAIDDFFPAGVLFGAGGAPTANWTQM